MENLVYSVGAAIIGLGLLIVFHEFGHFLLAKLCGVGVLTFSVGFGPKLWVKKKGETEYALSAFPLGGYVKMVGEDPDEEVRTEDVEKSFAHKSLLKRIAIVVAGPGFNLLLALFLLMKQLNKVVEVLKVVDLTEMRFLDRETALIKVHTKPEHRDEAIRLADIFRAKIVDSSPNTYTFEITGDVDKVEAMISMLQPLGIKDLVRTGRIAIARETTRTASPRREPALLKS